MPIPFRFPAATVALLLVSAAPAAAQQPDPLRGLDAYIDKARQDWGWPASPWPSSRAIR